MVLGSVLEPSIIITIIALEITQVDKLKHLINLISCIKLCGKTSKSHLVCLLLFLFVGDGRCGYSFMMMRAFEGKSYRGFSDIR